MLEDPVFLSWSRSSSCQEFGTGECAPPIMNDFAHWPFFGCLLVVIIYAALAIKYLKQYEGPGTGRQLKNTRFMSIFAIRDLDGAELWMCTWGALHPGWLFAFRLIAFCYFLPMILYNFYVEGFWVLYFYTQWTFILMICYFGVAAYVSAVHCLQLGRGEIENPPSTPEEKVKLTAASSSTDGKVTKAQEEKKIEDPRRIGYVMQALFQVTVTAVMMTDFIYWLILVPYVLPAGFVHTFLDVNMHFVNAVFLLVEISVNSMYYPWFRGAYVVFWTATYIVYQWCLHAIGFKTWPYPFLDLATPWAPAWYAGLSLFHLLLFILVMILVNIKQHVFKGIFKAKKQPSAHAISN